MNRIHKIVCCAVSAIAMSVSAQTVTPAALESTLSTGPYSISGANCGYAGLLFASSSTDGVINCTNLLSFSGSGLNLGRRSDGNPYGSFGAGPGGGGIQIADDTTTLFGVAAWPTQSSLSLSDDNNHYPGGIMMGTNDWASTLDLMDSSAIGGTFLVGDGSPSVNGVDDAGNELFGLTSTLFNVNWVADAVGQLRLGDDAASASEGVIITGQLSNGLVLMQNGIDVQDVKIGEWGGSGPELDGKLQLTSHTGTNPIVLDASTGSGTFSGSVGIGTTTPTAKLEVNGGLKLTGTSGSITFPDGSVQQTASTSIPNVYPSGGNVGIGTSTPQSTLEVYGWSQSGSGTALTLHNGSGYAQSASETSIFFQGGQVNDGGQGIQTFATIQSAGSDYSGNNGHLSFSTSQSGTLGARMTITASGNVGIGTTNPQALLDVAGGMKISGGGAGLTFPDGTVQSTAYTGTCTATGGDYAESVDITGERDAYEPGQLMVIDPEHPGHFLVSSEPYSTLVAGIYSTKPGYVGRRQQGNPKLASTEVPMAMVGIVPTKVTADNGPIKVGDLLVTSSLSGYAMKGTDRTRMIGAVVGKAMGKLDAGSGVIEVLVSLQ